MTRGGDQSGVSGTGTVLEGVEFSGGKCVVNWTVPENGQSVAIWDSFESFLNVHVRPHKGNKTVIEYTDGERREFE